MAWGQRMQVTGLRGNGAVTRGVSRKVCGAACAAALILLALGGCGALAERLDNLHSGAAVSPFSGAASSGVPLPESGQTADSSGAAEDAAEREEPSYRSIEKIQFSAEERFTDRALEVVDEILGHPRCPPQPFQCSLIDLTQDGVPELLFHDQSGEWAGVCHLFELSGSSPRYLGSIEWPIKVFAIYAKETDTGTEWMVEGTFSHGFDDRISHCILRCPDGEMDVTDCLQQTSLNDDFEPYATSFSVKHNDVLQERLSFSYEESSEDEIRQQMAGSLYTTYVQDDWAVDDASWVFEEELYDHFSQVWFKRDLEDLKSRINLLYEEWLRRQG